MLSKKISYKVISTKNKTWFGVNFNYEEMEKELNALGEQGWDLVNTFDVNHGHGASKEIIFVLKKQDD